MKIIISPTKKQNKTGLSPKSSPLFFNQSQDLRNRVKQFNQEEIVKRFSVSEKLSNEIFNFYNEDYDSQAAISMYSGAVFQAADIDSWSDDDFVYAQDNLWILSALYGYLKPLDAVQPYRLDFFSKIDLNLYDYWEEHNQLIHSTIKEPIINLASKEFSKMLPSEYLIDIIFLEENGKTQATRAKQARGDMLSFIITNKIDSLKKLQRYDRLGYSYLDDQSSNNKLVFTK
ncbi:YaaA family protein [Erysipelothrix urinaevulpis]|uniref:YaaA family protein n=1 Tax=Erysipelothrix urinaevulpis TaxID=2683717 RepID=UPI001357BFB0|nr:YaaA family protein [Erysipelothrix urinaevulpis]